MNAPDLTPGPGVRDAVLRRARVLRFRRQALWTSTGAVLGAAVVLAGGAVMQPSAARRTDVLVPGETTSSPAPSATLSTPAPVVSVPSGTGPTPAERTVSPAAKPTPTPTPAATPSSSPKPTPTPSATTPWVGPPDSEPGPEYADEYLDDHGTLRAYPAAYGTCEYNRDPDAAPSFPAGFEVEASGVHVEGTTVFFTVTLRNTGSTAMQIREETMVPMSVLTQGTRQMTGTGTFSTSTMLTHMLEPGDSISSVQRLHAVTCAHSRGPRAPLPAGTYQLVAGPILYPPEGFGGPVYAPPVTVVLP